MAVFSMLFGAGVLLVVDNLDRLDAQSWKLLVEVRDRLVVNGVARLDLPNLERIGFGVSRGDLQVGNAAGRVSAPRLVSVGRGAFSEPDDAFLTDHGVVIRADEPTDIDLGALTNPGSLLLDNVGRTPLLAAERLGDVTLVGDLPESLDLPVAYGDVIVRDTAGLRSLVMGMAEGQRSFQVSRTDGLQTITLDATRFDAMTLTGNTSLARVDAPSLDELELLVAEDNTSVLELNLGANVCPDSVRWTRNASPEPTFPGCGTPDGAN